MGLQLVELVMNAEDAFGISIDAPEDWGQSVRTVGELSDLVLHLLREQARATHLTNLGFG